MTISLVRILQLPLMLVVATLLAVAHSRSLYPLAYSGDRTQLYEPDGNFGASARRGAWDVDAAFAPPHGIVSKYHRSVDVPAKRFGAMYQRPQRNRYAVRCLLNPVSCYGDNERR